MTTFSLPWKFTAIFFAIMVMPLVAESSTASAAGYDITFVDDQGTPRNLDVHLLGNDEYYTGTYSSQVIIKVPNPDPNAKVRGWITRTIPINCLVQLFPSSYDYPGEPSGQCLIIIDSTDGTETDYFTATSITGPWKPRSPNSSSLWSRSLYPHPHMAGDVKVSVAKIAFRPD